MRNLARTPHWAAVSLLLSAVVACSVPHRDYSIDQIRAVEDLEELMDVQATVADPCFDLVEDLADQELSDAHWSRFQDMGTRLQATAARAVEFTMGKDYDRWNDDMSRHAAALVQSAAKRDKAGSFADIKAIQKSCRDCHDQYN